MMRRSTNLKYSCKLSLNFIFNLFVLAMFAHVTCLPWGRGEGASLKNLQLTTVHFSLLPLCSVVFILIVGLSG